MQEGAVKFGVSRSLRLGLLLWLPLFLLLLMAFAGQASVGPVINAIGDDNPPLSGRVVLEGTGFGTAGDVFVAGQAALYSTWTDTRIVAYVPESAPVGPTTLHVVVQGQQSNSIPLTVKMRSSAGRVRWTFEAEGNNLWWRPALAPDGTIYLHTNNTTDGLIYALSPDGALLWIQKVNWYPYAPPTAGPDGALYVGSIGRLYRISPEGQIDWQYYDNVSRGPRVAPTIGPDGLLYGAFDGGIGAFAMDPLTGQIVWSNPGDPVMTDKAGQSIETKFGPSNTGQEVDQFYVSMDNSGFRAFSLDGEQRFIASFFNIYGTAEVAVGSDGTLYGPRYLGLNVAAVDPGDGSTLWEYDPPDWAVGTNNVEIGPDDMLYFTGSSAKLEAFDPSSQRRKWQVFEQGMLLERPTISPDGSVLVVHGSYGNGQTGFVKGFNPTNGRELWTVSLAGAPYPEPRSLGVHHARITPDSNTAYMSTMTLSGSTADPHATLYAIALSSGPSDSESPSVAFDIPNEGDQVSGGVQIVVDASDNQGLTNMAVAYASGSGHGEICSDSPGGAKSNSLACTWDTNALPPGPYTLTATASDAAGNSATDSVSIQLVQAADPVLRSSAIDMAAKLRRGVVNVTGKVSVVDQDGKAVKGAQVSATWTLPSGDVLIQTLNTNKKGMATFKTSGDRGTYTLTVTNISKSGYIFDTANSVLSNSITK